MLFLLSLLLLLFSFLFISFLFVVVVVVGIVVLHNNIFIFLPKFQASIFMGFSITSAVMGGIIIICYSFTIAVYSYDYYHPRLRYSYSTEMALTVITLILGIVEFAIGIWAAICCCMMKICCSRAPPQQVSILSLIRHILVMQNFERAYNSILNELPIP